MKTSCRKSWCGNLFKVLNLTFDLSFKVKWGCHTKMSLYLPYLLVLWFENVKTDHEKSLPANVSPEKNFGLIFKNKIATIANYFKIIKML